MFVIPGADIRGNGHPKGGCMDEKSISIRTGKIRINDQRCKRTDCLFPQPTIRFDLHGRRVVASWSWPDVQVVNGANGVRVTLVPALMLVPISCN